MNRPLRVGVVGCGYWGPNLIRTFRSIPGCKMEMMCDINTGRLSALKSLYPDVMGETEFESMLNVADLDAIAIATPVRWHFPMPKGQSRRPCYRFRSRPH